MEQGNNKDHSIFDVFSGLSKLENYNSVLFMICTVSVVLIAIIQCVKFYDYFVIKEN